MWQDFKDFANRGRIFDMAIGIIIGAAFTSVVNSLVNDIIMPPIGMLLGQVDFSNMYITLQNGDPMGPYASLEEATVAGAVTINYGVFITNTITFLIVAFVVFFLMRAINQSTGGSFLSPKNLRRQTQKSARIVFLRYMSTPAAARTALLKYNSIFWYLQKERTPI